MIGMNDNQDRAPETPARLEHRESDLHELKRNRATQESVPYAIEAGRIVPAGHADTRGHAGFTEREMACIRARLKALGFID